MAQFINSDDAYVDCFQFYTPQTILIEIFCTFKCPVQDSAVGYYNLNYFVKVVYVLHPNMQ